MQRTLILSGVCALVISTLLSIKIVDAACSTPVNGPLVFGQSGRLVTTLQTCLIGAGYSIPAGVTGYYGAQTQAAVKSFYAKTLGLADWDGRSVGPQGRSALSGSTNTHRPITAAASCDKETLTVASYGTQGQNVRNLQLCLIAQGYPIPAGATGYYGDQTVAAVRSFYARTIGQDWHGRSLTTLGIAGLKGSGSVTSPARVAGYKRAASADEIRSYVDQAPAGAYAQLAAGMGRSGTPVAVPAPMAPTADGAGSESATRISSTNVQVAGIDEPDIVKTDGKHIFFSRVGMHFGIRPFLDPGTPLSTITAPLPYETMRTTTRILDAYPPQNLSIVSEAIKETGEMLLYENTLLVFASDRVVAYDVESPHDPKKLWERELDSRTRIQTARLLNGEVYLVTAAYLDRTRPCPMAPLSNAGMVLRCTDVWLPATIESVNTSYSILALSPSTGTVLRSVTFAGSSDSMIVSMFPKNLYLTSRSQQSGSDVLLRFFLTELTDLLSEADLARIRTIQGYDISGGSKMTEIEALLAQKRMNMSPDDALRFDNELQDRLTKYLAKHQRELDTSNITRIALDTLTILGTVQVPGHLLNQFSLDEHEGMLRIAVTVGEPWSNVSSENDVYILDATTLRTVGSIQGLGLTERIYAARFIGDRGYLVTFRQIDPFYVLDLSLPTHPRMTGELKIPGFSSYLEPLAENLVLGVGRDGSSVKLSLFDVSNPHAPRERDVYTLRESWTEVEQNHRAFLRDADHKIVFIPAGSGGHVLSYDHGKLSLKASVAGYSVKRAVYLNDNLYVIGDEKVTVLDEATWKEVTSLQLPTPTGGN